jgi:hypothetical protein
VITHPAFAKVLEMAKKDECQPIFLDVGSFGTLNDTLAAPLNYSHL